MAWYIVEFHTDAYPDHPQWMLTYAKSKMNAIMRVTGVFGRLGVTIRPDSVFLEPFYQRRAPQRPKRRRRKAQ